MARRKIIVPANCHNDRETYASGLCAVCYMDSNRVPTDIKRGEERQALVKLHQDVAEVVSLGKQAKAILRQNLPRYAELHLTAAEVAAADGDARPSQWALESVIAGAEGRAAEPPAKAGPTEGGGIKVIVGIQFGGVPAQKAEIVETTATSVPVDRSAL